MLVLQDASAHRTLLKTPIEPNLSIHLDLTVC